MNEDHLPHKHHNDCQPEEDTQDNSLASLLDRCGHYYFHRVGGRRRGQNSVLTWLASNPNTSQKELAQGLGITPASLGEVLMKLERKGLVKREKDENDRRMVRVWLTQEGKELLKNSEKPDEDLFQALTPKEQAEMAQLLSKLLTDWEERWQNLRKCAGHSRHGHSGDHRGCDGHRGHGHH